MKKVNKAIALATAKKAKEKINSQPYKLDINFSDSEYNVMNTEQEVNEWITKTKKENPTQEYMELKYYVGILVPINKSEV